MTALELTPEGQLRVMPLSVIQELIHKRNKLELQRNKLREALQKISMLSQTTCLSFEAQSFKATSIACRALADIQKEEK